MYINTTSNTMNIHFHAGIQRNVEESQVGSLPVSYTSAEK